MKTANCPSCGAPVEFRSTASILAVCGYCKSTLIRHDLELENLGRMADLMEDASPLQLGAEGRFRNSHFALIGRIQLRYPQGVWNEWHLLFDNQESGWLSEANSNYVLTFPSPAPKNIPAFDEIEVGRSLQLHGQTFQVINKETSTCIAGEGELPFKVGAGYEAPVIDLSNEQNFATLDFSETPPLLFIGEQVELGALGMTGLREREATAGKAQVKSFNCPSCAAPLQIRATGTESVACGNCGSVVDAANENHQILSRFRIQNTHTPKLPLGGQGHLRGADYDLVGYLRRQVTVDNVDYPWSEYLLYSEKEGFRWLSEYNGHWNFIKVTTRTPIVSPGLTKPKAVFLGTAYQHFQTATARITYVLGEFTWRVSVGEEAEVSDYVAPPLMLSAERTGNEITWSVAEYIEPEEVAAAFKLEQALQRPIGIAPNQPSPHHGKVWPYWKAFAAFTLSALLIQSVFMITSQNKTVYQNSLEFERNGTASSLTTEVFPVSGTGNLVVRNQTSLNNDWLYLDMELIERNSGRSYAFGRDISYYYGRDGGESWSEGNSRDEVVLSEVPPGEYFLQIHAETPTGGGAKISDRLVVVRDVPQWSNFFITLLGLAIFPLLKWWRSHSFESRRWAESDYASSSDDDSDDD
jgi:ribosomal protein L37AE/L43A